MLPGDLRAPWPYRPPSERQIIGCIKPVQKLEAVDVSVYTLGIWTVHPGRENDFVQAWRDMARKTQEDFPNAKGVLMHDRDVPNRFISTGPWQSIEEVEQWRATEGVRQHMEAIKELLEHFEPHTLDEAARID
ncbi:antibiotic biosynthesis monooxygenase [Arthrobacter oryzae]|uniref:Antibiotic biosynthesis monooxygenase n=1 Tax=Arthrobacter oryzae TaxID=409290 RepID=A0A3N0BVU5_9MICC|nr:antibiotic biosynthesis monooxygenase [Arthrobacter oryzae]